MSSAEARTALADVASTVEGVSVSAYFRQTTRPGDGFVRNGGITYPNKFGGVVTWQVLITLSQDIATAEKWLDTKLPQVVGALGAEMTVRTASPQQLALDTGNVPCVVIEGTRED